MILLNYITISIHSSSHTYIHVFMFCSVEASCRHHTSPTSYYLLLLPPLVYMSFNQPLDLEAGDSASTHYKDFPEFDTYSQLIDNSLYNVNNNYLVNIRSLLSQYGAAVQNGDDKAGRIAQKVSALCVKCTQAFKKINENTTKLNQYLVQCERNHEDEDTLRYLKHKESISVSIIKDSLGQFQQLQAKYDSLQKQYVESLSSGGEVPESAGQSGDLDQTTQGQLQLQVHIEYEPINAEELEQQTLLIEEREREIQQISQDTQEINDIFLNLQDIVLEQQFQIDNIEDNILSYSTDVQGASRELRKAERYQKRASGRMLCCLMILLGVFGSVVLIGLIF